MRFYDSDCKQLIYIRVKSTPSFWDAHWNFQTISRDTVGGSGSTLVRTITKMYINPKKGIILEGGCGRAQNVLSLVSSGFRCIGVDYASETVKKINGLFPELDIRQGDIQELPFGDNYFVGYWSIGVIEHFQDGYDKASTEMSRVLKPGGHLFLGFPYMSPLRRLKARLGLYPKWDQKKFGNVFYQYALEKNGVIKKFRKIGFKLEKTYMYSGIKGTKDEVPFLKPILQKIFDYTGRNFILKFIRYSLFALLAPFASHSVLLVLKKNA